MKARRARAETLQTLRRTESVPAAPELPSEKAFVLQLTGDTDAALQTCAGRLEHLSSGRRVRFETLHDLQAALRQLLAEIQQR
jgi:hypothetical protein